MGAPFGTAVVSACEPNRDRKDGSGEIVRPRQVYHLQKPSLKIYSLNFFRMVLPISTVPYKHQ